MKKIRDVIEEQKGESLTCPYCGHVNTDPWEWDEECSYDCEKCLMSSDLRVETSVVYITSPSVELLEDEIEDMERRIRTGETYLDTCTYPELIARARAVLAKLEGAT